MPLVLMQQLLTARSPEILPDIVYEGSGRWVRRWTYPGSAKIDPTRSAEYGHQTEASPPSLALLAFNGRAGRLPLQLPGPLDKSPQTRSSTERDGGAPGLPGDRLSGRCSSIGGKVA